MKRTVLHIACRNNDKNMVDLLLRSKPLPNLHKADQKGRTALEVANGGEEIKSLIEIALKRSQKELLHQSAKGKSRKVRKLVREGVSINCVDQQGNTPLHLSAGKGHPRTVNVILSEPGNFNPEVEMKNEDGKDCLALAYENGHVKIAKRLERYSSKTEAIDRFLNEDQKDQDKLSRILILGAGEAGKSTVVRQIKNKYAPDELSEREIEANRTLLMRNTIDSLQLLLQNCDLKAEIESDDLREACEDLLLRENTSPLSAEDAENIEKIVAIESINSLLESATDFYVPDSAKFYFQNIRRFVDKETFVSTEEDMLMARARTTGVHSIDVNVPPRVWEITDVGGQRSERKKWINFFDNVDGIIFVINLAGYAKVCFEDQKVNRMREAMKVFSDISNNKLFSKTPLHIFFNKKDLFEETLRVKPLDTCFPDYGGDGSAQDCLAFIQAKFQDLMPEGIQPAGCHIVSARFRKEITNAFVDVTKDVHDKIAKRK